jgi:hypothetical protein
MHETELTIGLEALEDRRQPLDVGLVAAAHQRVPVLQAPDTAGDAAVDEVDPLLRQEIRARLVLGPAGVPAVDDDVALVEQLAQLLHHRVDRLHRDHHPDRPRPLGQLRDELGEVLGVGDLLVGVVTDDGVAGAAQPLAHVATHPAESDEAELHQRCTPLGVW